MDDERRLRDFLEDRFPAFDEDSAATDDLGSVIDSLGVFEVVEFVEREFDVRVPTEEFTLQKFSSISRILQFVEELRSQ